MYPDNFGFGLIPFRLRWEMSSSFLPPLREPMNPEGPVILLLDANAQRKSATV